MRFVDFGQIQAEQTNNSLIFGYLVEKLNQPITDTRAYQLGVIDEDGIQIKNPSTYMEQLSFTPIDRLVCRLKRSFGDRLGTINLDMLIESAYSFDKEDGIFSEKVSVEQYSEITDYEETFKKSLAQFHDSYYNLLREANENNISTTRIETLIIETISNANNRSPDSTS